MHRDVEEKSNFTNLAMVLDSRRRLNNTSKMKTSKVNQDHDIGGK